MQVEHVGHQIRKGDHACPTLPNVTFIPSRLVMTQVALARSPNPDTDDRVKQQRRENEAPLDQRQELAETVDHEHRPLERFRSVQEAGIGRQVNDHVGAKRHDA